MPRTIEIDLHLARLLEEYRRARVAAHDATERLRSEPYTAEIGRAYDVAAAELASVEGRLAAAVANAETEAA